MEWKTRGFEDELDYDYTLADLARAIEHIDPNEYDRLRTSGTKAEILAAISQPRTMDHPLVNMEDDGSHMTYHIEPLLPHIIVSDIPLVFITVCANQTLLLWILSMTRKGTSTSHVIHVGAFLSMAWLTTLLVVWWM